MIEHVFQYVRNLSLPNHLAVPSHDILVRELKQLANSHVGKIKVDFSDRSRRGKELIYAEVGNGSEVIAISGGAHSDEPTGTVTCFHLIRNLLENETFQTLLQKYKFCIHPMLDTDGADLNYRWTSQAYSYKEYLRHHFRNGIPWEDCEHGIPASPSQVIRPELAFFKRNIEPFKNKIKYYITLHTTHRLGGSIFVLAGNSDQSDKISLLTQICERLNAPVIDMNFRGQDGIERLAPGFITAPPMAKLAEKYKDRPEIFNQIKLPTYEYVEHYGGAPLCMIAELPCVIDENLKAIDDSEIDLIEIKKAEIAKRKDRLASLKAAIQELSSLGVDETNLWFKNAKFACEFAPAGIEGEEKQLDQFLGFKAKIYDISESEVMDLESGLKLHQLYIKALEGTEHNELYEKHCTKFDQMYAELDKKISCRVLSLDDQIRLQTAMILCGVET